MKGELPSLTAIGVAFARASATRERGAAGEGLDPFARDLLPPAIAALADALPPRVARALSAGVVPHCELRSLAIDAVARDALGAGAPQMALLGAGLDARAWRLAEAADATTFEIDHPSTQRYKTARVRGPARDVRFVAVDFARDSLDARLDEAGHDRARPTVWIWEGVTPYLPPDATRATLAIVRARSAPGSVLAVTYGTLAMASALGALRPVARRFFALLGEPLLGLVDPAHFAAMLGESGFRVVDDTGSIDWALRFGARVPAFRIDERLAVAHVD